MKSEIYELIETLRKNAEDCMKEYDNTTSRCLEGLYLGQANATYQIIIKLQEILERED